MPPSAVTRIELWPRAARAFGAALVALSRGSLLLLLAAVVLGSDPPVTLGPLVDALLAFALLPAAAARALSALFRAGLSVEGGDVVLRGRGIRLEVPLASIDAVRPWRVPLPRAGFDVHLRSGARLRGAVAAADPRPALRALAAAGVSAAGAAAAHPVLAYAAARAGSPRRPWQHPLLKFVLFGLLPGGAGFYAHQHIAYGGLLGEYHLLGPASWLRTAALTWLHAALLLVLYAAAWRALVEGAAYGAAWRRPADAPRLRRALERGAAALYYATVPALLALRFLA
jgi:apolipoprotein N-acyltransferase